MYSIILVFIWISVLVAACLLYCRQRYSKFDEFGVKYLKPLPFIGNMSKILLRKEHFADDISRLYKAFPGEKFVGRYEFLSGLVMVRDLELIKKITVKDFENFIDRRNFLSDKETFLSRNLLALQGQEWKDMRSALSPAFTSSKIRLMVPLMVEVGDQMIESLRETIEASKDGCIDIECKDFTTRYSNDVIASCAFGLKVNSLRDQNNEFHTMGKTITTFKYRQLLSFIFIFLAPKIAKYFDVDLVSKNTKEFFINLVLGTMKNRDLHRIVRPDMIHLLMELKKGQLKHETLKSDDKATGFATVAESSVGTKDIERVWSDNDLISQAVLFFLAGFDTISTAAIFLLYEVALNPDVQEKLLKEINENSENGNKFDLKSIQSMHYLDMVVSEVLRKWPPGIAVDRLCVKDYNLGKPNKDATIDFIVRKGTGVLIPVYAIHRDPQYYPDPEKFDPERFSEENKHKINPIAYMPFGVGPRNCIGSRFALSELKVMIYQILQHFEVSPCEKTCIPAEFSTEDFNLQLKGGNWLQFRNRT